MSKSSGYEELKGRLDNHQIDVNELSFEEIDALCDMYEREISEIDNEIQDVEYKIELGKSAIRRNLDIMRDINNKRKEEN